MKFIDNISNLLTLGLRSLVKLSVVFSLMFSLMLTANAATADNSANTATTEATAAENTTKVLFISGRHSNKAKVTLLKKAADASQTVTWDISQKSSKALTDNQKTAELFAQYDLVILDSVSANSAVKTYESIMPSIAMLAASGANTKLLAFHLAASGGLKDVTAEQLNTVYTYWDNAGRANLTNLLDYVAKDVLALNDAQTVKVTAPIIFPSQGIYHPNQPNLMSDSLANYQEWIAPKEGQLKIALLMQRASIETEQTTVVDQTISRLEAKGAYVVPFFFELSPRSGDYSKLLQLDPSTNKTDVDLIINFRNIHWASKRKAEFEKFGVPVVQALTYYDGDQKAWEASEAGIAPGMMSFMLVLPESAGAIDPTIVAAMNQTTHQVEVIDYQLDFLVERAINYAKLSQMPNSDKKLTTMFWGDQDMGASFLNVPESLASISNRLNDEGYSIEKVDAQYFIDRVDPILNPFYRDFELEALLENDLAELLPVPEYKAWLATIPQATVDSINAQWGQPEDNFMVVNRDGVHYFIIPRIKNGNMLILRQPPRGDSADKEQSLYHNTKIPMNHYYLAAYFYAREYWNSDAFIHLGTHGTHEYLPGKDRGLSRYDGANLSTGTLPVMYPYIVDDVGEAMQAKRRGNAVTIGHMTPPFAAAGLQGVTADMHTLVDQYRHIDTGGVKEKTKQQIIDFCIKENLCKDLNYELAQINEDFDTFLEDLHSYLEELAASNQPLGLHSFGELSEQRLIISTVGQMLGTEFLSVASEFEKDHYEIEDEHDHHHNDEHSDEHKGEHSDEHADEHSDEKHEEGKAKTHDDISDGLMHFVKEDLEQTAGYKTLRDYVINANDTDFNDLNDEIKPFILQAQEYYKNIVSIQELDNLVAGLNNQYIAPKNGGDPIRNPASLPTGFNLIGFDPSRLPTKAAYEQGKELATEVIANYYQKHGQYPDKLAFSLWSVEAMRHYGVLESQALYAMGIKPKWSPDGRVIGTEIIPYSELKRPRVDVVLSATGLYRDAFPNVMAMLAKAIKELTELKEESNPLWRNYIRENSEKVKAQLVAEGVEEDEAEYLSSIRIFSNTFGDYGSGVDGPIMNSDTWETDKKIADNYLATMGKHFGADTSRWGEEVDNLYAKQLSGTDVALFARSSNLYGMITSDDPFEYFGSLALAVRNIDGKSPEMMISNLRNTKKVKMELAADMLAKELRTRNFHKRWISEMQKEGYSGAVTMSGNLNNFWGWQVVDPDVVRDDQWDEFADIYVNDKLEMGLDEWFEQVNPKALANMMERMLEAERKDYWETSDERLKSIVEKYIELVEKYDLIVMNDAVREHANELAAGFGLQPLQNAKTMQDMTAQKIKQKELNAQQAQANEAEQVEGQKLEKQNKQDDVEPDNFVWQALGAMLFIILLGGFYQRRSGKRPISISLNITK
ncbi:cobaltochelatase subunit CobN [Colwellia echini]|uniref:Cobaltochelatase subunit CobN n=1 Tax=Colwellia echini TaxID=1982103 RepID=A0ABY3MUW9_9GAMM|nr:cobaltochelatase subunit CobN [Colwellia echini]TYK65003.1 cobaltochelatase subunit CobN [Colwellia echini]